MEFHFESLLIDVGKGSTPGPTIWSSALTVADLAVPTPHRAQLGHVPVLQFKS